MPKNDDFLRDYHNESHTRMRQTSDCEFKLLGFALVFYPIITVAVVTLFRGLKEDGGWVSPAEFRWVCIGAALSILLTTSFMTKKIVDMHATYHRVGQSVRKVWRYFEMEKKGIYLQGEVIIPEKDVSINPNEGYGTGKGFLWSIFILWSMAIPIIVFALWTLANRVSG